MNLEQKDEVFPKGLPENHAARQRRKEGERWDHAHKQ